MWVLGLSPGPLQEQPVILTTEPSLQTHSFACLFSCLLALVFVFAIWDRVSLCVSFGCPGTHSVDRDGFELTEIQLPLAPGCWD